MKWGQERGKEPTEIYSIRLPKTAKQKLSCLPVDTIKATLLKLVDGSHQDNIIPIDSFSPAQSCIGDSDD